MAFHWGWCLGVAFFIAAIGMATPGRLYAQPGADTPAVSGVIDITGLMEQPRGNTRIPWTLPRGFDRTPGIDHGRTLREEILIPVERDALKHQMEVERILSR